jgi:hypothetical protein
MDDLVANTLRTAAGLAKAATYARLPTDRELDAGPPIEPVRGSPPRFRHRQRRLTAGPAYLGDLVSDLDFISAQPPRDLVYRDVANEHFAQRVHLHIRPLSAGIHG